MSGKKGAPKKDRTSTSTGDEKHQRKDFSVEVIFSSIPYTVFCGWKSEMYVDKRKPNSSKCSVLDLAWSSPKGNYYGPSDETIFIDCSQNNLDKFKNVTDDKKLSLTAYMSYAITRLKSIINLKSKDGGYGKVNIKIIAIHPCQKCLFALSALLGKRLPDKGIYKDYISKILKLDEYRFTFRWIQKKGWEFNVQYAAIFDAYLSDIEDMKGNDERVKELKILKEKYKKGDKDILYNGVTVDYDYIENEYERLTDPSLEDLRKNVKAMREQKENVEKAAARENHAIDKAMSENNPYEAADIEIENLRNSSPKYKNKSKQEIKDLLQKRGLIDTQHIKVFTTGGSDYLQAMGLNTEDHQHAEMYMIDGVRQDVWTIENRRKAIQERVDEAKKNYEEAQKAVKEKELAYVNGFLDALQLVASIGSIAFPPLALVDAYITVARWVGGPECTTQEHIMNGVGVAMDIAGLIPYFGTMVKGSYRLSRAAEGQIMEKLSQFNPNDHLEIVTISNQNWDDVPKSMQEAIVNNHKNNLSLNGIIPDSSKPNKFVTVCDTKGNVLTVQMDYDSAVKMFGKADGVHKPNIKEDEIKKAVKKSYLNQINEKQKVVDENIKANNEAIKKTRQDVLKALHDELTETATQKGGTAASTTSSLWLSTLNEIKEIYKIENGKIAKITDFTSSFQDIPDRWRDVVGIGYNGTWTMFNALSGIKYDPKIMVEKRKKVEEHEKKKPKWANPKDIPQTELSPAKEIIQAEKDLKAAEKANDVEAMESAKRRIAAAKDLDDAQWGIDYYGEQISVKNAQDNLNIARAEEDAAKKYYSQTQANSSSSYYSTDASIAYSQAAANTQAAEKELEEAKKNDYELAMARAKAQIATENIQYEKENYPSMSSSNKKNSKKK